MKDIPYFGNGAYCFADSTSMLLASVGENISPSKIEVLSGVGLGAKLQKGTGPIFFNWEVPDNGINNALRILGFASCEQKTPKTQPPPLEELKRDLKRSVAVVGPLDMGHLIYNPRYPGLKGVDHFILVYKVDDKKVHLHDPAGFPHVSLPIKKFILAWKTKEVGYGQTHYSYWTVPKRINKPSDEEIYQTAIGLFQKLYRQCDKKALEEGRVVGKRAILTTAQRIKKTKFFQLEIEHLIYFALPLGARRALDFASFFDVKNADLAQLKRQQARLFGSCYTLAVEKNWAVLAKTLEELAKIEEEFKFCLVR